MVDGTGTLRDSSTEPDLLWAARGGGNGHFGIRGAGEKLLAHVWTSMSSPAALPNDAFSAWIMNDLQEMRAPVISRAWPDICARAAGIFHEVLTESGPRLSINTHGFFRRHSAACRTAPIRIAPWLSRRGRIASLSEPRLEATRPGDASRDRPGLIAGDWKSRKRASPATTPTICGIESPANHRSPNRAIENAALSAKYPTGVSMVSNPRPCTGND